MPVSVAEFVQATQDSGILTPEVLAEFAEDVAPKADATPLANRLVKAGRLSAFQAKYIYGGKAKSLLLGPYVVLDVLGKGGMGYVYKAEHRKMRRVVALKVIARAALESPDAVRRFEREVQAAARLEHPNIVTAFDAGEASGTHYLVMQYVEGRNLSEVVKELGPQPLGRTVDWILQAARGLAFAHEQGVIHRDIKPGNLLVDSRGTVKILDMGLARLENLGADQDQLTGTGQIMGTVDYMAPEQAVDTRQADARADIYSLGVTLWYLLTARPLFAGDTAMNKMMAHMQTPVPPLASGRGDVPPAVEAAFQRMVAKKPADRFQSMREVIAALEALPQGVTAPGPPCILLGDGPTPPGLSGTAATQTLQRQAAATTDENTARLGPTAVDTQTALGTIGGPTARRAFSPKPLHLAVGGGAVGALVLVGVIAFAFSGRRGASPGAPGGESRGGSSIQSVSQADSVANPPMGETTPSPRPEPAPLPDSTAPPTTGGPATAPPPANAPFGTVQARKHQEAWAKHLGIPVETTNSIGQTLIVIPPGKYMMGDGRATAEVTLSQPYLMGTTEVTRGQWRAVMATEPWKGSGDGVEGDDVAAANISPDDAEMFCLKLTGLERRDGRLAREQAYRLPIAAEWEHACRAGTQTTYSFGDDVGRLGDYAWFLHAEDRGEATPSLNGPATPGRHAHGVGQKKPGPWGLFDMHGNVWERCQAWSAEHPQTITELRDAPAAGPLHSTDAVGGCFRSDAVDCRSAARFGFTASGKPVDIGLRVVLNVPAAAGR
jgi:formylglycine-generating enzyme required for sulfatase activity/predicted Ser/Thr protein kinase